MRTWNLVFADLDECTKLVSMCIILRSLCFFLILEITLRDEIHTPRTLRYALPHAKPHLSLSQKSRTVERRSSTGTRAARAWTTDQVKRSCGGRWSCRSRFHRRSSPLPRGHDAERDAADAAAVRGVGGRAALRRDGRLLGRPPLLLVAIRILFLPIAGQYSLLIWTASVRLLRF